jgi:hypothetical protein
MELRRARSRPGVASVIGTIFFVFVFMLALGALAYQSGVQSQASYAQQVAVQEAARRGAESLSFSNTTSGLLATDEGPTSVQVNHVVLKFANGTVYALAASTSIPSGGSTLVQPLIPGGACSPGAASCLSKYRTVVSLKSPGSSVGLVTSMGNSFWYSPAQTQVYWSSLTGFPPACPAGQSVNQINTTVRCVSGGAIGVWAKAPVTTSGTGKYGSTSLGVVLGANGSYAFYAFTALSPSVGNEKYNFEVHSLTAGATLVIACTPMSFPTGGGNQPTNCVSSAGAPIALTNQLAFGVAPPVSTTPGLFGVVTMGATGGTLQIDFACTANCGSVTLKAGSFMLVQPVA